MTSNVFNINGTPYTQPDIIALPPVYVLPSLPSWVIAIPELNRRCLRLMSRGWEMMFVEIPGMKVVECRHRRVHRLDRDYLYVDEAEDAQGLMDGEMVRS